MAAAALLLRILVALAPVFLFLGALMMLDSYKLVRLRLVLAAIATGCASAVIAFGVASVITGRFLLDFQTYSRYVAPAIEEFLKALYLVHLFRSHRIGFVVDAAICGFAVGAGFSTVENLWYVEKMPDVTPVVWIVRGFGTAVMHGGATAIFAIIAKTISERSGAIRISALAPGFLAAAVIHSSYNHFFVSPVLSTIVILVALPPALVVTFRESERVLRKWLQVGFDTDQELLQMIVSGDIGRTKVGMYFQSLQVRFRPETVVDMIGYLRIHLELTIQAKGILLMREAGFDVSPAPDVRENFAELRALAQIIGRTGLLALHPFLHTSGRELWQLHMLGQS